MPDVTQCGQPARGTCQRVASQVTTMMPSEAISIIAGLFDARCAKSKKRPEKA